MNQDDVQHDFEGSVKFLQICVQDNETSCGNDEIDDWSYENECLSS